MESGNPYEELRGIAEEIESATQLEGLRPAFYRLQKLLQAYPADAQIQSNGSQLKQRLVARGSVLALQSGGSPALPPSAVPPVQAVSPPAGLEVPPHDGAPATSTPSARFEPPPPPVQGPPAPPNAVRAASSHTRRMLAVAVLSALLVLALIYVGVHWSYKSASSSSVVSAPARMPAGSEAVTSAQKSPQTADPGALNSESPPQGQPQAASESHPPPVASAPPAPTAMPGLPAPSPSAGNGRVHVQRYPSLEAPDTVASTQSFALQVSLTMEPLSPGVQVVAGPDSSVDASGKLSISLPDRGGQPWNIGVVLNAPDFEIAGASNQGTIQLPPSGDSTPALFQLKPKHSSMPRVAGHISATFWHEGAYLARATRVITIVANDRPGAITAAGAVNRAGANTLTDAVISSSETAPDLTLYVQESRMGDRTTCQLTIESPYLQPASAACIPGDTIRPWLAEQYSALLRAAQAFRGFTIPGGGPAASKEQVLAMVRGLGQELYRRVGGPLFDDAFWKLVDREQTGGSRFRTIQIYTNNPVIPWELMVPVRGNRTREACLGVEFDVARWHINDEVTAHDKPPSLVPFNELAAIVPQYAGGMSLPHQNEEISALEKLRGFNRVRGQMSDVAALLRNPPNGIVHFAGHGVAASAGGQANSAIELEGNASLDSMSWRGMARTGGHHPLYFFNACDVGQARRVLNFVDGWAPTVLDGGAAGFLGGLWPLGDKGAADFAMQFYRALSEALNGPGAAQITELLAQSRRQFYTTGDPTFLGYVFYGDVGLRLVRP